MDKANQSNQQNDNSDLISKRRPNLMTYNCFKTRKRPLKVYYIDLNPNQLISLKRNKFNMTVILRSSRTRWWCLKTSKVSFTVYSNWRPINHPQVSTIRVNLRGTIKTGRSDQTVWWTPTGFFDSSKPVGDDLAALTWWSPIGLLESEKPAGDCRTQQPHCQ